MHFKPKINLCVVFIQIHQHREICRGETNLRKCLLSLEEKITAAAESRGAGCSLFDLFSVSTVGLERSEQTTTSPPFRFWSRSNESFNRNQRTPLTTRWVAHFWKWTFRVVLRTVLWIPIASHCEAGWGDSKWAKYLRKDQWSKFQFQPLYVILDKPERGLNVCFFYNLP